MLTMLARESKISTDDSVVIKKRKKGRTSRTTPTCNPAVKSRKGVVHLTEYNSISDPSSNVLRILPESWPSRLRLRRRSICFGSRDGKQQGWKGTPQAVWHPNPHHQQHQNQRPCKSIETMRKNQALLPTRSRPKDTAPQIFMLIPVQQVCTGMYHPLLTVHTNRAVLPPAGPSLAAASSSHQTCRLTPTSTARVGHHSGRTLPAFPAGNRLPGSPSPEVRVSIKMDRRVRSG